MNTHVNMFTIAKLNALEGCMPGTEDFLYEVYGAYMKQLGVEWDDNAWDMFEANIKNGVTVEAICKEQYMEVEV